MAVDATMQGGCHCVPWDRKGPSGSGKGHGRGTDSLQSKPALLETCTLLSLLYSYSHLVLEAGSLRWLCWAETAGLVSLSQLPGRPSGSPRPPQSQRLASLRLRSLPSASPVCREDT